jgi:hypothetical protein
VVHKNKVRHLLLTAEARPRRIESIKGGTMAKSSMTQPHHGVYSEWERLTASAIVNQVSRRHFLQYVGKLGFSAGMGMALSGILANRASAKGTCAAGACGPSPRCDYVVIDGRCLHSGDDMQGRVYDFFTCQPTGVEGGSWTENWSSSCQNPGRWQCRDCAYHGNSGGRTVSSCGSGTWTACIRAKSL